MMRIELPSTFNQYWAALAVNLGAFAAGTTMTWTSSAYLPLIKNAALGFSITEDEYDLIGCSLAIGAAVFCIPTGLVAMCMGLRLMMLLIIPPFLAGWLLIIFASNVWMLYLGRLLQGLAGGCFLFSAPMFIGEIAQKEIRGELAGYYAFMNCGGMLFTYVLGSFLPIKVVSYACMSLVVIYGILFAFEPESPMYFIRKNNLERAKASLEFYRRSKSVDGELKEMVLTYEDSKARSEGVWELLRKKSTRKALAICVVLQICYQCSGIDVVMFYSEVIFEHSNITIPSSYASIITGIFLVTFTFIASKLVDRCGRRVLLIISSLSIITACGLLTFYYSLPLSTSQNLNFIPIVAICLLLSMFAIGHGSVTWVITAEVLPNQLMGSVIGTLSWSLAVLTTLYFNRLNRAMGLNWSFGIFMVGSTLGLACFYVMLPETKCLTAEEIQEALEVGHGKKKKYEINGVV